MRTIRSRCLFCWLVVLVFGVAAAPTAQARIIRGNYYQDQTNTIAVAPPTQSTCENNVTQCFFMFAPVPKGKQLIIDRVTCEVFILALGPEIISASIRSLDHVTAKLRGDRQYLKPGSNKDGFVVFNEATSHLVLPRDRPIVQIDTTLTDSIFGRCTIAGQLTNAN